MLRIFSSSAIALARGTRLTLLSALLGARAHVPTVQPITDWEIPDGPAARGRDLIDDGAGGLWFVAEGTRYVGRFDLRTEQFTRLPLDHAANGLGLLRGQLWMGIPDSGRLASVDAATGAIARFKIPDSTSRRDPRAIAIDTTHGFVWFVAPGVATIGRFDPRIRGFLLWNLPSGAQPTALAIDQRGRAWVAEAGVAALGLVDTETRRSETIELPDAASRPAEVAVDANGDIWYTDAASGRLGRYSAAANRFALFELQHGTAAQPTALAIGRDRTVWVAQTTATSSCLVALEIAHETWKEPHCVDADSIRSIVTVRPSGDVFFLTSRGRLAKLSAP